MVDISGDVDDCYQKQLHYYQLGGGEEKPLDTWGRRGGERERRGERKRGREGERERGRGEKEGTERTNVGIKFLLTICSFITNTFMFPSPQHKTLIHPHNAPQCATIRH